MGGGGESAKRSFYCPQNGVILVPRPRLYKLIYLASVGRLLTW